MAENEEPGDATGASVQDPGIEAQTKGLAHLYLLATVANVGPLGQRINVRKSEQRRMELAEYARKLHARGMPTDEIFRLLPKMLDATRRHLENDSFDIGELMDEMNRYVDECVASGEDRITVIEELMAAGREWGMR